MSFGYVPNIDTYPVCPTKMAVPVPDVSHLGHMSLGLLTIHQRPIYLNERTRPSMPKVNHVLF